MTEPEEIVCGETHTSTQKTNQWWHGKNALSQKGKEALVSLTQGVRTMPFF
jgi:hypothetical protein